MQTVKESIRNAGIVPVVKIDDAGQSVRLADALLQGGLPVMEITFRTDAAEESIRRVAAEKPDMLVGAGTVLTVQQAQNAAKAGAKFLVAPGLNPDVVKAAQQLQIPIVPGVSSATEIEAAMQLGLDTLKFFPAESIGGVGMMKALCAPYQNIFFIPTGGIDEKNLCSYLAFSKVLACGGSWMVKSELIQNEAFDEITARTQRAVSLMHGFELRHIGINCAAESEAREIADTFGQAFGFGIKNGTSSLFAGSMMEIMKQPGYGAKGHIAVAANDVARAMAYLQSRGFSIRQDSVKYKNGAPAIAYLEKEIGGFAVHLVGKE